MFAPFQISSFEDGGSSASLLFGVPFLRVTNSIWVTSGPMDTKILTNRTYLNTSTFSFPPRPQYPIWGLFGTIQYTPRCGTQNGCGILYFTVILSANVCHMILEKQSYVRSNSAHNLYSRKLQSPSCKDWAVSPSLTWSKCVSHDNALLFACGLSRDFGICWGVLPATIMGVLYSSSSVRFGDTGRWHTGRKFTFRDFRSDLSYHNNIYIWSFGRYQHTYIFSWEINTYFKIY